MSIFPESHRDLLDAHNASLTTLGKDGGPQSTIVWFAYDSEADRVKLSLSTNRLKTKNLLARPQVSLMIPDPSNAFRFMDIRGTATTEPDVDYAWASAHVNPKYNADVRDFDGPNGERLIVTIEPKNVYVVDMSAG